MKNFALPVGLCIIVWTSQALALPASDFLCQPVPTLSAAGAEYTKAEFTIAGGTHAVHMCSYMARCTYVHPNWKDADWKYKTSSQKAFLLLKHDALYIPTRLVCEGKPDPKSQEAGLCPPANECAEDIYHLPKSAFIQPEKVPEKPKPPVKALLLAPKKLTVKKK